MNPKKNHIAALLILSTLCHVAFGGILWGLSFLSKNSQHNPESRWQGVGVFVANIADFSSTLPNVDALPNRDDPQKNPNQNPTLKKSLQKTILKNHDTTQTNISGANPNPAISGEGEGLDESGPKLANTLAKIRKKIDQNKFMPKLARENNLSGSVRVFFQITTDGNLEKLAILKSSGHTVLDEAALLTVQKSAPFPYYKNPVAIELEYQ